MISPTGNVMWNPSGVSLQDFGNEQDELTVLGGSNITFAWKESVSGANQDIAIQRYTNAGSPVNDTWWPEDGYFVAARDTTQSSPYLMKMYGNAMIVAYEDYSNEDANIYCKFIEAWGELLDEGTNPGTVICDEIMIQQYPLCASLCDDANGSAVIVWSDGRSSGKEPIFGLYAQKVDNQGTENDDESGNVQVPAIRMQQNFPNPFNPVTKIEYVLQKDVADMEISVYNIRGQKVKVLLDGVAEKGVHSLIWDGTDDNDKAVSSGVYFYKLHSGSKTISRKMVLMK
jgi:hypothetical protein